MNIELEGLIHEQILKELCEEFEFLNYEDAIKFCVEFVYHEMNEGNFRDE